MTETEFVQLLPNDEHNQQLEANVRPPSWSKPGALRRRHPKC
jgi:hypothetical protein